MYLHPPGELVYNMVTALSIDSIPDIYKDIEPQVITGVTPLQIALMNFMATCSEYALQPNDEFIQEMKRFSDSKPLTPLTVEQNTGLAKQPDIIPGLTGIDYIMLGEDVFLQRIAQDCGPDEQVRYENVLVGKRTAIAQGTFAHYGKIIYSGKVSNGTNIWQPDGPGTGA